MKKTKMTEKTKLCHTTVKNQQRVAKNLRGCNIGHERNNIMGLCILFLLFFALFTTSSQAGVLYLPTDHSNSLNYFKSLNYYSPLISSDNNIIETTTKKPLPVFSTLLWPYTQNECIINDFSIPCHPEKYILPDNKVVKYYAGWLDVQNGRLVWKENNTFDENGNLEFNYKSDQSQFGVDDYWQNPDYFLTQYNFNPVGDCEDIAVTLSSIYEAKGVKTKILVGYATVGIKNIIFRSRDIAVEVKINGTYYRSYFFDQTSDFLKRGVFNSHIQNFEPELMFDKETIYYEYNKDW